MKRKLHKFTKEQAEFIQQHSRGRGNQELTDMFNQHFGLNLRKSQIISFKKNNKLKSGLTSWFKPGHTPYNKGKLMRRVPIGAEAIDSKGYVKVKIAEGKGRKNWQYKHVLLWEAANGPIPPGHVLLFGDGNKQNVCLENLLLVTKRQRIRMNQLGLIQNNIDLTKTGLLIADIRNKIGERKRNGYSINRH